jgi:hypothetical protein
MQKGISRTRDQKQAGIAIRLFHKVDFKTKLIRWDNEGHFILKGNNPSRGDSSYKHVVAKCQNTQFHKKIKSTTGHKITNKNRQNNNETLQYYHSHQ